MDDKTKELLSKMTELSVKSTLDGTMQPLSLPAVDTRSRAVGTIIYKRGEQHPRLFALIVSREPLFVFEFEDALFAFA